MVAGVPALGGVVGIAVLGAVAGVAALGGGHLGAEGCGGWTLLSNKVATEPRAVGGVVGIAALLVDAGGHCCCLWIAGLCNPLYLAVGCIMSSGGGCG